MNKKKLGLMIASIAMVASVVVFGTMAYFTDRESIANTFTVGNIDITLDEADVNSYGEALDEAGTVVTNVADAARVTDGNEYKLVPGRSYVKDPTMTIVKGSEPTYARLLVTISHADVFDAIFDAVAQQQQRPKLIDIFNGYDKDTNTDGIQTVWQYHDEYRSTSPSTITYEFRYYNQENVGSEAIIDARAATEDMKLPALFEGFTVPGYFGGQQIQDLNGMSITVIGQAIQADSFVAEGEKSAEDAAWDAFDVQVAINQNYKSPTAGGTTATP